MLAEFAELLGVDHATVSKCLKYIRNNSKARTLDAVRVEAMSNGIFSRVNSCFNGRKGKVFCTVS